MTAPQTYGAAPKIIDDTTYVPAKMFEPAVYNFSAVGQYASFTKAGADDNNAVQIPNPLVEYKSVDEAKSKLSFTAPTPSYVPDGYSISYVGTIAGDTLRIFYRNGEKINLALFKDGASYALFSQDGINEDEIIKIIAEIA